jgi:hypothetical protein
MRVKNKLISNAAADNPPLCLPKSQEEAGKQ